MLVSRVESVINVLACLLLLVLSLLTLFDVVGRNLLSRPVPGATELTELALMGVTFLFYPLAAYHQKNIVIDMLDDFTPVIVQRVQLFLANLLGALFFAILAWRLFLQGTRLASYGDVTPFLRMPVSPAYYVMAVLAAMTTVAFLIVCVSAFTQSSDRVLRPNERLD